MKTTLIGKYMNEISLYGGLPMRKRDIIRHAKETMGAQADKWLFCFEQSNDRNRQNDPERHEFLQTQQPYSYDELVLITRKER